VFLCRTFLINAWMGLMQDALDKAILKDQRSDLRHAVLSVDVCRKQSETFCCVVLQYVTVYYATVRV